MQIEDELCNWPEQVQVVSRANVTDQWSQPVTPLTQDLVVGPQERAFDESYRGLGLTDQRAAPWSTQLVVYGWVYLNLNRLASVYQYIPGMTAQRYLQGWLDLPADPEYAAEPGGEVRRDEHVTGRFEEITRFLPVLGGELRTFADKIWATARQRDWATVEDRDLVATLEAATRDWLRLRLPLYYAGPLCGNGIGRLMQLTAAHADDHGSLFTAMIGGVGLDLVESTTLMDEIRRGLRPLDDFAERYGYRGPNEYELEESTWAENTERLAAMIEQAPPPTAGREAAATRQRARDLIRARVAHDVWDEIERVTAEIDGALRWREDSKTHEVKYVAALRLAVREAGRRLTERGVLACPDDVFYLRLTELGEALRHPSKESHMESVSRRRRTRAAAFGLAMPHLGEAGPGFIRDISPAALKGLGFLPAVGERNEATSVLRGQGVSHGVVRGIARVVLDPYDAAMSPGDILVTSATDPAWVPVFARAAGVVLDHGSLLSHGAMLARELGIPCVVNLKEATSQLRSGDLIEIDGGAGTVSLVP